MVRVIAPAIATFFLLASFGRAAIVDPADNRLNLSTVTYKGATGDIKAYLATPKAGPARRPGVIVIHENRGLNAHIEDITRRVALEGFTALGLDLLSPMGGTPKDEDQAREMIGKTDRMDAMRNAAAAIAYLKSRQIGRAHV